MGTRSGKKRFLTVDQLVPIQVGNCWRSNWTTLTRRRDRPFSFEFLHNRRTDPLSLHVYKSSDSFQLSFLDLTPLITQGRKGQWTENVVRTGRTQVQYFKTV